MNQEIDLGTKVKYHTGDEKWKNGVVHAVRKVDDVSGQPRVLCYVIDTGGDERIDVYEHNLKDAFHAEQLDKHLARGLVYTKAHEKAVAAAEKMPDKTVQTVVRQPEQIDVAPEWVKQ